MKKYYLMFLLLSLFFLLKCSDTSTEPLSNNEISNVEKQIFNSSEDFGYKIFKEIHSQDPEVNIFISPLSISMALGMTMNGAANETYSAMQNTLELSNLSTEEINGSYKNLNDILTQIDPKVIMEIANSIWYREEISFDEDFIETNKKYFYAEVEGLDFSNENSVDIINNWIENNTNGKLKNVLDNISSNAIMYLVNAIYFNGTWKYEFDEESTSEDLFKLETGEKVNCNMMAQSADFNYYSDENISAVELPYGDGSFSMTIILPNYDKTTEEIIKIISSDFIKNIMDNYQERECTIQLPRFKLDYRNELKDELCNMGMSLAFSGSADFSNMTKQFNAFISRVIHQTFLQVDEEGTEAAAVTIVEIKYTSTGDENLVFRVDRPFIFLIQEKETGSTIFMGKILNPEFF